MKQKIMVLKAKRMGHNKDGRDPEKVIKGNTFKSSGLTPHRVLGTAPKLKAKYK